MKQRSATDYGLAQICLKLVLLSYFVNSTLNQGMVVSFYSISISVVFFINTTRLNIAGNGETFLLVIYRDRISRKHSLDFCLLSLSLESYRGKWSTKRTNTKEREPDKQAEKKTRKKMHGDRDGQLGTESNSDKEKEAHKGYEMKQLR